LVIAPEDIYEVERDIDYIERRREGGIGI